MFSHVAHIQVIPKWFLGARQVYLIEEWSTISNEVLEFGIMLVGKGFGRCIS